MKLEATYLPYTVKCKITHHQREYWPTNSIERYRGDNMFSSTNLRLLGFGLNTQCCLQIYKKNVIKLFYFNSLL